MSALRWALVGEVITVVLAFVGFLFALRLCAGCSPAPTVPAYCTNEAAFTTALLRCVDKSSTRAESRECRKAVNAQCGMVETLSGSAHD